MTWNPGSSYGDGMEVVPRFRPVSKVDDGAPAPDDQVVELLSQMLAEAKAGKVRSCVVVAEFSNGGTDFGMAWQLADLALLIAEIERAKLIVAAKWIAERHEATGGGNVDA